MVTTGQETPREAPLKLEDLKAAFQRVQLCADQLLAQESFDESSIYESIHNLDKLLDHDQEPTNATNSGKDGSSPL